MYISRQWIGRELKSCPVPTPARSYTYVPILSHTEMLETKQMNSEERLYHVKTLFEESVKLEEKRALDKKLNKRKRQGSGTSMTSTISSISSNTLAISPPNKKMRGLTEGTDSDAGSGIQPLHLENAALKNENHDLTSTYTSLPLKKRGTIYSLISKYFAIDQGLFYPWVVI